MVVFERGVVYSKCRVVIPQWRSLCGRSNVDIMEILLCEGGDVEQCSNLETYLVVSFDPLSLNSISLISCIILYCTYLYARYSLCVLILVLNQERFI